MTAHCTVDKEAVDRTIETLCAFDADEDVLVIVGHDASLIGNIEFFPSAINRWNLEMYTRQWAFLGKFAPKPLATS